MKEKIAYIVWFCLYVICVGLGTVDSPQGFGRVLLILTALIFFLPGAFLLYIGIREKNRKILVRVRIAAVTSLTLTLSLLVANMFTVLVSEETGKLLHEILALVSAPMLCAQYWVISLFLWACLLFGSFIKIPKDQVEYTAE